VDFSSRYQFTDWLFADVDLNLTRARSLENPDRENYIPLAPSITSKGGLTFNGFKGFDGSLRYRYIDDRPANEDNSVIAEGYLIFDAVLKYNHNEYQIGFSIENIFNQKWNEAQFDTESRLQNETMPVSEIHFTPGTPFFFKAEFTYSF
jgi:outer membrane receptor protein involved in Fe transport